MLCVYGLDLNTQQQKNMTKTPLEQACSPYDITALGDHSQWQLCVQLCSQATCVREILSPVNLRFKKKCKCVVNF